MADDNNSLMNSLVKTEGSLKKGRVDFAKAMQKMGFTSVFDIVRLSRPAFIRQLATLSDANAGLAYDNAMAYAVLIARLYREHKTSSGTFQQLAQRTGIRALAPLGPTFSNLFNENWDEFCKVGAMAAIDAPPAYLSELRVFILQLEATSTDPQRILLDRRRPDLKDLLITHESTFTPRPMLELVNEILGRNLRIYLDSLPSDRPKSIHEVLIERRYPFEMPYNFYHHQCQLGLADNKPRLGELNYQTSLVVPIKQAATNDYGQVLKPVVQAQRLLSGLSPQQQALLIQPSVFSNFYLTRNDLLKGWKSAGTTHLRPHTPLGTCYLLPLTQEDIGTVTPPADQPVGTSTNGQKNIAPVTFRKADQTLVGSVELRSITFNSENGWLLNCLHAATVNTLVSYLTVDTTLPEPAEEGYTARFNVLTATGSVEAPVNLARQSFTLTLDEQYTLTAPEQAFFKQSYGVDVTKDSALWKLATLTDFMAHTGLHAEQVEMLLARRAYAVRLSPNCKSLNPQHTGVEIPGIVGKVLPFPHSNHYGACYVNGTGTGADLYDSVLPPSDESIIRDQFDNAMGLEQVGVGDSTHWRLTKTSLDRLDRLQRMVRLQRWTQIPFAHLDTMVTAAIRAEGDTNLAMELNENTLRALGVYRHLKQRYGIEPQEFAALMHDLSPYASGKDEVPLFDHVFNRVQLFDTPLILDQASIDLAATDAVTQKTVLQLCAGLGVQPTADSLLLIAAQTKKYLGDLKRDLPTLSSIYRQSRIARLFGYSVADLLTLAGLLGGLSYKTALASGRLSPRTTPAVPDILDVLMQLDWAVDWLRDSQQTVAQLQQRLGPVVPLMTERLEDRSPTNVAEPAPLPDELLSRLKTLRDDTRRSLVTETQVAALGLPLLANLDWFALLVSSDLLDKDGLLKGLDLPLELVDAPDSWLEPAVVELVAMQNLTPAVKALCEKILVEFLLGVHDRQTQVLEGLFQETAKLPTERCVAVIHWAHSSVYYLLLQALPKEVSPELIEHFQRVSRHAELAVQLRLSNSALRLFLVNSHWLGADLYPPTASEPSLSDVYLFERFSHWFHSQSQSEDSVLSYFSIANPGKAKLKNKALRQLASQAANAALARLLEWSEVEVAVLTDTLLEKRASSMAHVDWVRRCQATCRASGLSAAALLQATGLNDESTLDAWKTVGDAVIADRAASDSLLANG